LIQIIGGKSANEAATDDNHFVSRMCHGSFLLSTLGQQTIFFVEYQLCRYRLVLMMKNALVGSFGQPVNTKLMFANRRVKSP
jgi:hypothetical protein